MYRSPGSREAYNRLIGEWYAKGGTLPGAASAADRTVNDVILAFPERAQNYYVVDRLPREGPGTTQKLEAYRRDGTFL